MGVSSGSVRLVGDVDDSQRAARSQALRDVRMAAM